MPWPFDDTNMKLDLLSLLSMVQSYPFQITPLLRIHYGKIMLSNAISQ